MREMIDRKLRKMLIIQANDLGFLRRLRLHSGWPARGRHRLRPPQDQSA